MVSTVKKKFSSKDYAPLPNIDTITHSNPFMPVHNTSNHRIEF